MVHGVIQRFVFNIWRLYIRKQVAHDSIKKHHVLSQELGQVDIANSTIDQNILLFSGLLPLKLLSRS